VTEEPQQAAAAEQAVSLDDLVRHFSLMAAGNPELRQALEAIPIWRDRMAAREQSASSYTREEESADHRGLLADLIDGMRAAAESHPELARVLTSSVRNPGTAWSLASRAVDDERQARRSEPPRPAEPRSFGQSIDGEQLREQWRAERARWARTSSASPPAPSGSPARPARIRSLP
jgi:hypothetical protein